jgi:CBS domain containing-hemolysin-like protein
LEIALAFSNKLRLELDKPENKLTGKALALFYKNQNSFLSVLWLASIFSLFGYVAAVSSFSTTIEWHYNRIWLVLLLIFLSVLILFVTTDIVLRLLFRCNPTSFFRFFAQPLFFVYVLIYPFLKIYTLIFYPFGNKKKRESFFSINKIYSCMEGKNDQKDVQTDMEKVENEVRIFQNALDFSRLKLKNCIVPRTEIVAIELNASVSELLDVFVKSSYSRILVYRENIDNIVGYVHSSDMFDKPADIQSLLNPLVVVPETMAANKLLKLFLQQRRGIALVVDEFGGTAGVITLEDVMEEIFGEIEDEHDEENEYIAKRLHPDEYLLSGRLEIKEVNEQFGLELPVSEDYVTVAGLILSRNEILPAKNDNIQIGKYQFSVLKVAATRIELIRLKVINDK